MGTYAKNLRAWEIAALLALCTALCAAVWARSRQSELSTQVLRLHVVAVSDAPEEQALKLRVRDAVLACLEPELQGAQDAAQARGIVSAHLQDVADAAHAAAEGRQVSVSLGWERYPTRHYEGFALPAGEYDSLRVVLGEGEGHNWWCVVFPPLCLTAADAEKAQAVMAPEDYALICEEEGYQLRFRVLELWGELVDWLEK